MASALDELRKHTAALQGVVRAAHEIERVLERVQAELVPLVGDLEEVRRGIEKLQKQRDAAGWSWAVLAVICSGLGGIVGGLMVLAFCR
jgi:chromosome segregation ATPase